MKTGKLIDRVAVVTGASKGIGAGIAKHLAAEGAAVVVNYSSSKEGADKIVDEITKRGGKAIAIQGDVAKEKDIERLFAETKKAFGRVDILVNNAGVYQFAPLEDATESEFHREFNTNVLGLILATQEAVKHFGADGGSVINISSAATSLTPPTAAIYTATKGAWAKENSGEFGQSRWSGDRRFSRGRLQGRRFRETHDRANAVRPPWTARRHRAGRFLSRFIGCGVDHRRSDLCRGRTALIP
jgi:NAD(P)-dependent dehydrogenase (short-subunit alcohol dehydrogenase family)